MKKRIWIDKLTTPLLALPLALLLAHVPAVSAQTYAPLPSAYAQPQAAFPQQDLDRMLAPIALYPDSLLSQILMAATYPLEVVQAARWSRTNPGLQGDDAVRAIAQAPWDPSVKSLVAFPQILAMMDETLEWTERLGDAFLAQEAQVMDSVQYLRQSAHAAGTLRSDDRIRVLAQRPAIEIVPVNPQIVYVPYYDPTVVYGTWRWPQLPVHWAPWRGYHPPRPGFFLAWGSGIPVVSGFFFGAFDWPRHQTRVVSVNTYYYARVVVTNRQANVRGNAVVRHVNPAPGVWQHNPEHRHGAPYRDAVVRAKFIPDVTRANTRSETPAVQPQARAIDDSRNTARDSRTRVDEHAPQAAPRAGSRQEPRPEIRSDDRQRQQTASRNETRHDGARRLEAYAPAGNRAHPPKIRREAPPAPRSKHPAPQPPVEDHAARPAPVPLAQPRIERAARPVPATPAPQPRTEATRERTSKPADTVRPAPNVQHTRPAGGTGPRPGDGQPRGKDPQRQG